MRSAFDPAIFAEYWQLNGCHIDTRWQRQDAGMLALSWGILQAQAKRVPVVMKANPRGASLYEKSGFRRLKRGDTGWPGIGRWCGNQGVWEGEGKAGGEGKGED